MVAEIIVGENTLDDVLLQDENKWEQCSCANWLKHDDQNTTFFHQKVS